MNSTLIAGFVLGLVVTVGILAVLALAGSALKAMDSLIGIPEEERHCPQTVSRWARFEAWLNRPITPEERERWELAQMWGPGPW